MRRERKKLKKCSMLFCPYPKSSVLFCRSPISNAKHTKRRVVLCTPTYAETKPTTSTTDVNMMDFLVITAGEGEMRKHERKGVL